MQHPARHTAFRHLTNLPRAVAFLAALLGLVAAVAAPAIAQETEADLGFSPTSGHARVIAQGVVPLPAGEAVWRTVRTQAPLPADAPFTERPLGFVLATTGPLLLVDEGTGEQMHLGVGEAALVRDGARQQRTSLSGQPVSYLSIELVASDAPPPPAMDTVLQPGQPFVAPGGLRDLNLLSDTLAVGEAFLVPDSGAKNVILVTEGALAVGRPGGEPVVLLAGEAASFSGELQVAASPNGLSDVSTVASFVVAMIGPEIPPPALPSGAEASATTAPASPAAAATAEATDSRVGSITVEVFTCPAGMTMETLNAAACAPATGVFDVTISGAALASPLTIGDASSSNGAFTWEGLPPGDYVIAEAVIPSGYDSYVLSAQDTTGNPAAGYRVTLDANAPDLAARIYNFAAS